MTTETEHHELAESPFRVGDWLVDPRLNRLTRGDESVQIELKMMDVLVCLAGRAGEVVSRREIIDTVWATEFITEKTLTRAVAELRRTLGDDAKQPRYIETIHRKGYRLIAPVQVVQESASTVTPFPARSVEREDDTSPYPGLAAFTEEDAEFFFGREAEVTQLWRKITTRRLLAVIGPSGVGKSSFLRAGLLPAAPEGWGVVVCQPGDDPLAGLARALLPDFEGDRAAVEGLVGVRDIDAAAVQVARWRQLHRRALLIVDQFEELFTLNPQEVQRPFAKLLGNLARKADVHVLLSLRDDFLFRCHDHEELEPIFDALTPVRAPVSADLRRALEQPAARFGYAFEDDRLVGEMVEAVGGERGALPLLAFTVARLWEERDRERKLLTRRVYAEMGGVEGALAHHAEATLERVGRARSDVVRELFRNLVTAEGTRAVREKRELLSVFDSGDSGGPSRGSDRGSDREAAEDVLHDLVDARLLTSFEVLEEGKRPRRRIEIIHESLLGNWPRLVGWQTQDADSARLRDELRQAARTWREHDRSDDLLWTGSAYREFVLWRERYPGGLNETEEAFGEAMTRYARRTRRRRRTAVAVAFAVLLAVLAAVGVSRQHALAEANRAEASKLVALAQVQLLTDPTEALAYATASLQLADNLAARTFVMRALWEAPPALVLESPGPGLNTVEFSPTGRWAAFSEFRDVAAVWSDTGEGPVVVGTLERGSAIRHRCEWASDSLLAITVGRRPVKDRALFWSIPEGQPVRTIDFGGPTYFEIEGDRLLAETRLDDPAHAGVVFFRSWRLPDGEPDELGRMMEEGAVGTSSRLLDPSAAVLIYARDRTIFARRLQAIEGGRDRVVGSHDADGVRLLPTAFDGDRFASRDREGEIRIWSLAAHGSGPLRVVPRPEGTPAPFLLHPDPSGRWVLRGAAYEIGKALLWDLAALPGAQPLELRRSGSWMFCNSTFHPTGDWLSSTTKGGGEACFWPLGRAYPSVVEGASTLRKGLAFSPDGRWLASRWPGVGARLFALPNADCKQPPELAEHRFHSNLVFDPASERLAGGHFGQRLMVVPLNGGEPRRLEGFHRDTAIESVAFSPSGRLVAAASGISQDEKALRVWDLESGEVRVFDLPRSDAITDTGLEGGSPTGGTPATRWDLYEDNVQNLWFTDEETLFTVGAMNFLRWDLKRGSYEEVMEVDGFGYRTAAASADGAKVLMIDNPGGHEGNVCATPKLYDLFAGTHAELPSFGDCVRTIAIDTQGAVAVTGDADGVVRVGRVDQGEPHLLAGHEGAVECVAVSADLRWVASVGSDGTLRLWSMPDLAEPPLHSLPRAELIAKLETLTNLRAVRDEESSTGWKIEVGSFPGWAEVPEW